MNYQDIMNTYRGDDDERRRNGRSGPANGRRQGRHGNDPRPAAGGKDGMDQNLKAQRSTEQPGGRGRSVPARSNTLDRRSQMNVFPGHTTGVMAPSIGRPQVVASTRL